jgi:hypothetical protein
MCINILSNNLCCVILSNNLCDVATHGYYTSIDIENQVLKRLLLV